MLQKADILICYEQSFDLEVFALHFQSIKDTVLGCHQ